MVTQLTKCYLKNNIAGGTYGKTGASPQSDATCVKGADNWLKFALQVSNQPAAGAGAQLPGGLAAAFGSPRGPLGRGRNVSALNGAGARGGSGGASGGALALAAAVLAVSLL